MKFDYLIVGAGFAGAIMAERIASQLNKKVLIFEKRYHIGGNAYDKYDENGILVHCYGPHVFHTNSKKVIDYLSQFTEWRAYEHKVLAKLNSKFYPIPINRITINNLYNLNLQTEKEVDKFYNNVREKRYPIINSEDIIVNQVGTDLFEKFFKHFTIKQWGLDPKELNASVCGRIPIRNNTNCNYFTDKYQLMPKDGYTKMFEKILSHKNVEVVLNTDYKKRINDIKFDKFIYTGPIDYFFDYQFGRLPYRSIKFEYRNLKMEYYQSTAQINYVNYSDNCTRVVEHKYLSGQSSKNTTVSIEFPQSDGEPFYPIPTNNNRKTFLKYLNQARNLKNVKFVGRLAEYQYYNMDQVVANTLKIFEQIQQ